uniref:J domain-containing protein n=1 Tax=Davidia involucrata TaxID=16924 RepID=A0A5B6YM94_DAVIN
MEPKKEEALRAKENAEKLFARKDFAGAKNFALKAQTLYPELEGISQMVATIEVYIASAVKVNGEFDFYSILGLEPFADKAKLKKQYRKMAVLLHPDKNKSVGADGAFKLVSEAWTLLSDRNKRNSYDLRRNKQLSSGVVHTNTSLAHTGGVAGFDNCSMSSVSHTRLDTFWTVCTSCQVQYEYLRKYLNKRLSCKNCRGIFIAVETGAAPVNGSFPYCPWSYVPDNGYGGHGFNGVTYVPTTALYFPGNGVSGFHSGHGSECVTNVSSFQWSSFPGASAGVVDPNGLATKSAYGIHHANGNTNKTRSNGKHHMKNVAFDTGSNVFTGYNEPSASRVGKATKKRKVDVGGTSQNGNEAVASKTASEVRLVNGNGNIRQNSKLSIPTENPTKRCSVAPAFDARKLLIEKARTEIRKKLEEIRLASTAAAAAAAVTEKNEKVLTEVGRSSEAPTRASLDGPGHQSELKKTGSVTITVPDSDFHDFDKDRAEECFKPKQIWALYDEEDGMPRLYCLIRQVISVKPFKIHISYLNSKTDSEFGSVNWVDSGFTKSCGNFRAWNSDIVDQVNVFSHLLSREKAGRGGCVRIYPKSGDVWAVYRNWSPNWNRTTPDELRHQYEMVEVLDDYSEELGVCVTPLVKLDGFKTVYQRNSNKDAIRWIPRREMLRFSHQVPSCLLKGESNNLPLPDGCWDLDPAATPDELLQEVTETKVEEKPCQADN